MANPQHAYSENVSGNFFVDDTCIDCDLCRQIAPSVFEDASDHSYVAHQPESPAETHRAAMALVTCPTASIGTRDKSDSREAAAAFPDFVRGKCTAQATSFKSAVWAFDSKNKVSKKQSESDAEFQIEDFLSMAADHYANDPQ